jgi:hypothetical protein
MFKYFIHKWLLVVEVTLIIYMYYYVWCCNWLYVVVLNKLLILMQLTDWKVKFLPLIKYLKSVEKDPDLK